VKRIRVPAANVVGQTIPAGGRSGGGVVAVAAFAARRPVIAIATK
jgi:hypothetical protein